MDAKARHELKPPGTLVAGVTISAQGIPSFWIYLANGWLEVTLVRLCEWLGDELPGVAARWHE